MRRFVRRFVPALAAFAVALAPVLAPADPAPAGASLAAAADNELAVRAALDAMKRGGNAVDGAIAASLVLDVTANVSCGIGGGGFALVRDGKTGDIRALDYRETAPAAFDAEALRAGKRGAKVGTPGEIAGLLALHARYARRSFAEDAEAAISAAERGFATTAHLAAAFALRPGELRAAGAAPVFAPTGAFAAFGETIRHPALGATIRRVATEGARAFYAGPVAAELVETARAAGGTLAMEDLASYQVVERTPLRAAWGSREIVTMPPPSAGGIMLLQVLGMYSTDELRALGERTGVATHVVAEAMRGALADRMRAIGDPAFAPDRSAELLAPAHLARRKARIAQDRTHAPARFELPEQGTTHLVVADRDGGVVSLTTTINTPFGAVLYAPKSGVLLDDELDDFTPIEQARKFGLANGGPNAPRAGARPVSSMTPTIVLENGAPVAALGGSGGLRICENVVQTAISRLVFGRTPAEAVSAPRFLAPPNGPSLVYGADQLPPPAVVLDLAERGEQVSTVPTDTSGVQMIAWERGTGAPRVLAGADPRKHGFAAVEP